VQHENDIICPDCDELTRRDFVRTVGGMALAGAIPLVGAARSLQAAPTPKSEAETAVKALYESLSAEQKKVVCFPFEHELRHTISANWKITKPTIGDDFYTRDQRKLVDRIFRGVTSPEGYERFQRQMREDWGGFEKYHMAIFGEPGTGKFEWEMTGRHLTIRADGNNVDKMAFGGPIVYGHGSPDTRKNLFHYQTKKANEVFGALEGKQRTQALVAVAPRENAVPLQGKSGEFPGIPVSELSADQKQLVENTIKVILAPYREEDIDEALKMLKAGGGLNSLHMAFYTKGDLNKDKVWDLWRVEGPTFVWHFRGAPHVHTYVNIGMPAKS
jgi:hypothetical protein